jgi:nucleotide-binding universal stress UspA family protein
MFYYPSQEAFMPGIICAIRGGPASQPTIDKSISLAKESGQTIYFLYVINLDFLTHSGGGRIGHISEEMKEMGEFILLAAQEQAREHDLCAEMVTAEGKVIEEIIALSLEIEADYIVLGRPGKGNDGNLLAESEFQTIVDHIEENTHAAVVLSS